MHPLDVVAKAELFSPENQARLEALKDDLAQTWETVQIFRTRTEMLVSVLKDVKHPTPDSKYWQAVREQNVQFQELVMLSYEYRKNRLETRKLERDRDDADDPLEKEIMQVDIDRNEFIASNMARTARERLREILEWSDIKAQLRPLLAYGDADVNAHQLEAMHKRFGMERQLVTEHTPPADARNILGLADMAEKMSLETGDRRPEVVSLESGAKALTSRLQTPDQGDNHDDAILPV